MSTILRSVLKNTTLRCFTNSLRPSEACLTKGQTRSIWNMCSLMNGQGKRNFIKEVEASKACFCGCGLRHNHSKGNTELVDFLSQEIVAETKLAKSNTLPVEVDGFKVKLDGSDVSLTKTTSSESIEVSFNVNHSIDADNEPEQPEDPFELKSKPRFDVDIKRGNTTLGFTCSFVLESNNTTGDGYEDLFSIDEVTLYEGEWNEKVYAVSGELLDGHLYDLFMDLLDKKGITNEFVSKLIEFSTTYERNAYISLLEGIKKFASEN